MRDSLHRFNPVNGLSVCLAVAFGVLLSPMSPIHASPGPGDVAPSCELICYSHTQSERPGAAGKRALNLDTGDPRTVGLIHFVPKDSLFRASVEDSIKRALPRIRSFFARQMQAHGYGNMTFDIETDTSGELVIHRVTGRHPGDHYAGGGRHSAVFSEIRQIYDTSANIYVAVIDYSRSPTARGGRLGKTGGEASVGGDFKWETVAHELGHTFGLEHDFRKEAYIMSYSSRQNRLSACAAEFLSAHPYFNPGISIDAAQPPTVELESPTRYSAGTNSVSLQVRLEDTQGLHQAMLLVTTRESRPGLPVGYQEVKSCRGLTNGNSATVQFEYDGDIPSSPSSTLSNYMIHPILVKAVDSDGNVSLLPFDLVEVSPYHIATLEGHTNLVEALTFSPDGSILVSASFDNTFRFWDTETREHVATLENAGRARSLSISHDGRTLASASDENSVKLWDVGARTRIATLHGHTAPVNGVAFSPDGTLLASASNDGTARIWNAETRGHIATLEGHTAPVNGVVFSSDGTLLATASDDGTAGIWNVATRQRIATLAGHTSRVGSVAFSPDGTLLASASGDGTARLWDVEAREHTATLEGHTKAVSGVAFSPDGTLLASASLDRSVRLWDVATREYIATVSHTETIASVDFSPDGTVLAAGSITIELWETTGWTLSRPTALATISGDNQRGTAGEPLANPLIVEVRDQYDRPLPGAQVTFTVIAGNGSFSAGFTTQNATTGADGRARITLTLGSNPGKNAVEASIAGLEVETFNAEGTGAPPVSGTGRDHPTWDLPKDAIVRLGKGAIGKSDRSIAFSPDGRHFAVSSGIGVWLYTVGDLERAILLPSGLVHSLAFSSNGATLASGGVWRGSAVVRLWEVASGSNTATVTIETWSSIYLSLSPDGKTFAFPTGQGTIQRLDVDTGRLTDALPGDWSFGPSMSFSPDGTTIASGEESGFVRLWDLATGASTATLDGHRREVLSVTFAPDGKVLASASADGTVKLWDVETSTVSAIVPGDRCQAACVAFSPDGATLASGWTNRTVTLWDVAAKRTTATFSRHREWLSAVTFSPDGRTLASASEDGDVYHWDLTTGNATAISGHTAAVWGMAFSPDGTTLASRAGTTKGKVHIWDALTGLKNVTLGGHDSIVRSISFAPDGTTLASASMDRTVRLWDLQTHSTVATLPHGFQLSSVSFSPDGNTLASGDFEGSLYLWDVKTEYNNRRTLPGLEYHITSLLFAPDGGTVVAGTYGGEVRLWDAATGATIRDLDGHSGRVLAMSFSPDGETLATASHEHIRHGNFVDPKIRINHWNVAAGTSIAKLDAEWADDMAFSPDGTKFATGSQDKLVRLYDLSTGDIIATFEGHNHTVTSVLFTPDGQMLASGSEDGTILLWDLAPDPDVEIPDPDFNGDGTVGFADFIRFAANFGRSQGDADYDSRYDLDGDGAIAFGDFVIFAGAFGKE